MKKVTVRELRYQFPKVERALRAGNEIKVTKRNRTIARIVPDNDEPPEFPDFERRLRETFGDRILQVSSKELLDWDRGER